MRQDSPRIAGYVEISGKLYPAWRAFGEMYFSYREQLLAYDTIRDGALLIVDDAKDKYPEYFV